jgi:hypothetical protein
LAAGCYSEVARLNELRIGAPAVHDVPPPCCPQFSRRSALLSESTSWDEWNVQFPISWLPYVVNGTQKPHPRELLGQGSMPFASRESSTWSLSL